MNLNLLKRALKDRWRGASIFGLSLFLYAWMMIWFMPVFLENVQFKELIAKYPKAIMSLFAGASNIDFFSPEGFMTVEFLALWFPIIVIGFAITMATAIVSKEVGDGTMDFLLAQPISRQSLILSRFAALILYLIALVVITFGSMPLLGRFYDVTFKLKGLLVTGLLALAFFMAISAYTLFLSVILRERGHAIVASISIFIGTHLLNAFADLNETVEKFRFLSMFKYYQPYKALATGEVPWRDISIFLAIMLVFFVASLAVFRRKDISV